MIIDFHTHAFADAIAERAISKLEGVSNLKAYSNGTISNLVEFYEENNIDKCVLLPIATKPTQQTTINNWAVAQKSEKIIPFGSIHPDATDVFDELERIKSLGLKGIKLHPDYQGFFIDDEKLIPIYKKCAELGLVVIFHAGYDPLSPDLVHAMPEASARVFKQVPNMTMILAHLGGMMRFDDVEKYLVGLEGEIYLDTAYIDGAIDKNQLERIIKNHGANRILFGSDFPWHTPNMEYDLIQSLDITEEEKNLILSENAMRILGL